MIVPPPSTTDNDPIFDLARSPRTLPASPSIGERGIYLLAVLLTADDTLAHLLPLLLLLVQLRLGGFPRVQIRFGRSMHSVEPSDIAVAAVEFAVVKVVEVGLFVEAGNPWQPVARVVRLRAQARADDPHEHEEDVRPEDNETRCEWDQVRYYQLDGVRMHRCEGKGRGELVVDLVDALVQRALVQRPVHVEEKHLVDEITPLVPREATVMCVSASTYGSPSVVSSNIDTPTTRAMRDVSMRFCGWSLYGAAALIAGLHSSSGSSKAPCTR